MAHIEKTHGPHLLKAAIEAQERCLSTLTEGGAELVIAISEKGSVKKVYVNKETKPAECMKAFFSKKNFPKPVVSPLYLYLDLD